MGERRSHVRRLVLDFTKVKSISSSALGIVVSLNRKITAAGGSLKLFGLDENVSYLFSITTLDKILSLHPTLEAALAG